MKLFAVLGPIIAAAIAVAGAVAWWHPANRFQIVSVRTPDDPGFDSDVATRRDPNDPTLHQTLMLDTVTGRTWLLAMVPIDSDHSDTRMEWWTYIGYRSYPEPDAKVGTRLPH